MEKEIGRVCCGWMLLLLWMFPIGCREVPRQQGQQAEKAVSLTIPHPLQNEQDLDILLQEIGDARVVLLGEASHGPSAYYTWRAAISRRLIQEKEFDFIAVEGEWADSYRVNNFIKGLPRYIPTSDFARFRLQDMEAGQESPFTLQELP